MEPRWSPESHLRSASGRKFACVSAASRAISACSIFLAALASRAFLAMRSAAARRSRSRPDATTACASACSHRAFAVRTTSATAASFARFSRRSAPSFSSRRASRRASASRFCAAMMASVI